MPGAKSEARTQDLDRYFPKSRKNRGTETVADAVLKCKWTILILADLADGFTRPSQILRRHPELTPKVLWERLNKLVSLSVVCRRQGSGYPKKTCYRLTAEGRRLSCWARALTATGLSVSQWEEILRCRHTLRILRLLLRQSARPKVLRFRLSVTDKVLFDRLRKLESTGLVQRRILSGRPIQVFYAVTPQAQALRPLLDRAAPLDRVSQRSVPSDDSE